MQSSIFAPNILKFGCCVFGDLVLDVTDVTLVKFGGFPTIEVDQLSCRRACWVRRIFALSTMYLKYAFYGQWKSQMASTPNRTAAAPVPLRCWCQKTAKAGTKW